MKVKSRLEIVQETVDNFYKTNGDCCAGCDWWRYHNSVAGDCTRSAPVTGKERSSMLGIYGSSLEAESGHIMTRRDHVCGDFIDSHDWSEGA